MIKKEKMLLAMNFPKQVSYVQFFFKPTLKFKVYLNKIKWKQFTTEHFKISIWFE